jgi:uncharacterized lipoprotein YajG
MSFQGWKLSHKDKEVYVKHMILALSLVLLASCATNSSAPNKAAEDKTAQATQVQSELRQTLYSQLSYDFR